MGWSLNLFVVYISLLVSVRAISPFNGRYSDPNHPGCAREIVQVTPAIALVYGSDAAGGEGVPCDGTTDIPWGPLNATLHELNIIVDFAPKGGPSDLSGVYDNETVAIDWEDGNSWTKL
jgi:hypothetical protein